MSYVIDQKNCSGCHRCRMECPVEAISFKNDKYWIDPEKCISCGTCQTVCHNGCISDPEAPAPQVTPHDTIKMDCDVVVIGAGAAGMVAAAKAQDLGNRVIVLEKNHEIGGSAWYASGFIAHYSMWHKEAGFPDNREKKYNQFLKKTAGHDVDPELLKRYFQANADWIDWMIDEHELAKYYEFSEKGNGPGFGGLKKKLEFTVPWNDRRIDGMIGPGGAGWAITTLLEKDITEKGGQVLCSTPAKELKTNDTGEITGVVAEDAGGRIEISCKAVVVASGAFTRSREIMDKMQPLFYDDEGKQPVHIFTCSTCTGDGITMCEKIGADIDYVNRRVNMFGPMRHPYPGVSLNSGSGPMFQADGKPYEMEFKMAEVSNLVNAPGRYVWKVTDDANWEANINHKIEEGRDNMGVDISPFLKKWRQVIQEEADGGSVVIGNTIAELAEKLGFDPDQFQATIDAYNEELKNPTKPPMMFSFGDDDDDEDMPAPPAPPAASGGPGEAPAGFPGGPDSIPGDFPGGFPSGPDGAPGGFPGGFPGAPGSDATAAPEAAPGGPGDDGDMGFPMMGPPAQPLEKGPFYAIKMFLFHENSIGGMTIDKNASVLKGGKPIPGLYAAGDTTRGIMIPGDVGVNYVEGVFTALTQAFNEGYIAGEEAGKYAKG